MSEVRVRNLGSENSLVSQYVGELRDIRIQSDRLRFRRNLERLGEIFAYEISKEMQFVDREITTPLAVTKGKVLGAQPVLAAILRAGLPMHQGLLNYFDSAENAFISAYRKHKPDGSFEIELEYLASPRIEGKVLIVSDPMLGTGASIILTLKKLLKEGVPARIHVISAIASQPGIDNLKRELKDVTFWTAAIDPTLNDKAYIVPGLGDAGDLAFGGKVQA